MFTFDVDIDIFFCILCTTINVEVNMDDNQVYETSKHLDGSTITNIRNYEYVTSIPNDQVKGKQST